MSANLGIVTTTGIKSTTKGGTSNENEKDTPVFIEDVNIGATMKAILKELKKMNLYLAHMNSIEISDSDIDGDL